MIFDGYHEHFNETARLTILKALAAEPDYRLNETMLMRTLEAFAIRKSAEWLRTQIRWLEREAGAIIIRELGTVLVAELTKAGRDHIEMRSVITGILRPSPVGG